MFYTIVILWSIPEINPGSQRLQKLPRAELTTFEKHGVHTIPDGKARSGLERWVLPNHNFLSVMVSEENEAFVHVLKPASILGIVTLCWWLIPTAFVQWIAGWMFEFLRICTFCVVEKCVSTMRSNGFRLLIILPICYAKVYQAQNLIVDVGDVDRCLSSYPVESIGLRIDTNNSPGGGGIAPLLLTFVMLLKRTAVMKHDMVSQLSVTAKRPCVTNLASGAWRSWRCSRWLVMCSTDDANAWKTVRKNPGKMLQNKIFACHHETITRSMTWRSKASVELEDVVTNHWKTKAMTFRRAWGIWPTDSE